MTSRSSWSSLASSFAGVLALGAPLALAGCPSDPMPTPDAGMPDDAPMTPDAPVGCDIATLAGVRFSPGSVGTVPGGVRELTVALTRDHCSDVTVVLTQGTSGIATIPASVTIPVRTSSVTIDVTGVAVGRTTLTASVEGSSRTAEGEVVVTEPTLAACSGGGGGMVQPNGTRVAGTGGLASAGILVPEAAGTGDEQYRVAPFQAAIACDELSLPEHYLALGPAVSFTSETVYRFSREIEFTIPLSLSLLPDRAHRGHVEVLYTGPGVSEPRIVAITNPVFEGSAGEGTLRFVAPRLGTYQAVVRDDVPHAHLRHYNFRGILGFSMGGSGSGRIGLGSHDLFDFVAPLGGPTDWQYLLEYIRRYHLGGFCTAEERAADTTGRCDEVNRERPPGRGELFEHTQTFENWWYEDMYEGQGGTFNREDYIAIFRDLSAMFSNPNTDTDAFDVEPALTPSIAPPGTPESLRTMPDSARCGDGAEQVVIHGHCPDASPTDTCAADGDPTTGWYDDEYNPDGRWDVISFCDGGEIDVGNWDPSAHQFVPIEVAYAVDVNHDGLRNPGEPVIRNGRETFDDLGCDRTPSAMEAGFDPIANPDPAGDDYDFQYNPNGTEGNYDYDAEGVCPAGTSERFDDFGIDGVDGTPQIAAGGGGGYDVGEGDGHFNRTRGAERMISSSPRGVVRGYRDRHGAWHEGISDEALDNLDVFADGGVRDLFNWVVQGNHTMGGFASRGLPVRYYDGFGALHLDGRTDFEYSSVPWAEIGRYTMVRYGNIDAQEADRIAGDGGHVGTTDQLLDRMTSAVAMMSARWPDGNRVRAIDNACRTITPTCRHVNVITEDFTSSLGRTGPYSLVLPPGYFDEENADTCYPIVYFLHGYGMDPEGLSAIGFILWSYMNSQLVPASDRIQKMIFVFPDGRCRGDECLRGTFYTDAPESTPHGAQMQTWLLDLDRYIREDRGVRVCAPRDVMVVE
ncbi:MAG: hypothetical protein K1X94_09730 [Sandaracinaceae bacterium]|nr:hypothetical protein [Sandaracinaceae bacterium]